MNSGLLFRYACYLIIKYKPKKVKNYQALLEILTLEQLPKGFNIVGAGTPITVNYIEYVYAYPKSLPKKRRLFL